jgi:hypothetical protein
MTKDVGRIIWLGWRWPEATAAPTPAGASWRAHYAAHASFPEPRRGKAVAGAGVLVVDASDFPAVQAVHAYRGDWIVIAVVPDQSGRGEDYEVRLQTEARIYGGLRDLEIAAVAGEDGPRTVFIVDVPGSEPDPARLTLMAKAVLELRETWDIARPGAVGRWPARCRMLNMTGDGEGGGPWRRYAPPATGEAPDPGSVVVQGQARFPASQPPLLFQSDGHWLAVGRPHRLADFPAARIYYESARMVFGAGEGAWPEPGDPDENGLRRFLEARTPPDRSVAGPADYLDDLAGRTRTAPEPDGALPPYVLRWLGLSPIEGGD